MCKSKCKKERDNLSRLLYVGVVKAARDTIAGDRQHVEIAPNNFTVGICFQLRLNFVPHFFLRIELRHFSFGVFETFDVDSITDVGTTWNFQRFTFIVVESAKNVSFAFDSLEF